MPTPSRPGRTGVRRVSVALLLAGLVTQAAGCGSSEASRSEGDASSSSSPSPTSSSPEPVTGAPPEAAISAHWEVAPGRLGPLRVGTDAATLSVLGLVQASDDSSCEVVWRATPDLSATGTMLDFRAGEVDDLDQVSIFRGASYADSWRTAEGKGIGTTTAELEATYAERLHEGSWPVEGGTLEGRTVFGPDGALTFEVAGGEVIGLHLTAGPTPQSFAPPVLGC